MKTFSGSGSASLKRLTALLRDADGDVRVCAAVRLGDLGAEARPAAPALVELLGSESVLDQRAAALALGKFGPAAAEALAAANLASEDRDATVRRLAAEAAQQVGRKAARGRAA